MNRVRINWHNRKVLAWRLSIMIGSRLCVGAASEARGTGAQALVRTPEFKSANVIPDRPDS